MRTKVILLGVIIFGGCASAPVSKVGYIGITGNPTSEGIEVASICQKCPSQKAGLIPGDVITSYNGKPLSEKANRQSFYNTTRYAPETPAKLVVKRDGQTLKKTLMPKKRKEVKTPVIDKVGELVIRDEQHVRIAVIVQSIVNTGSPSDEAFIKWQLGVRPQIQTATEQYFLNNFNTYKNFGIVDRNEIDDILAEQKFQISGAVNTAMAKKIGELSGATHLCLVNLSRFQEGSGYTDQETLRLIDIESGNVIASQSLSVKG